MTDDQQGIPIFFKVIAFILISAFVAILTMHITHAIWGFDVSNIPEEERWSDLNNKAARDAFCKSMGYSGSTIYDSLSGHVEPLGAGSAYGYDIYCTKVVEKHETYDYSEYKRWLTSVEIENNRIDVREQYDTDIIIKYQPGMDPDFSNVKAYAPSGTEIQFAISDRINGKYATFWLNAVDPSTHQPIKSINYTYGNGTTLITRDLSFRYGYDIEE